MTYPDSRAETSGRPLILRLISAVLALLAAPSACRDLYGLIRGGFDPLLAVFGSCTALFIALCVWFAMRGNRAASRARMRTVIVCGLAAGAVGLGIGFFGPLVWAPGANQGPLLGIFITGPIGLVIGAVLGWFYSRNRTAAR